MISMHALVLLSILLVKLFVYKNTNIKFNKTGFKYQYQYTVFVMTKSIVDGGKSGIGRKQSTSYTEYKELVYTCY